MQKLRLVVVAAFAKGKKDAKVLKVWTWVVEKDYRFMVVLYHSREWKKDDVPARLSQNEFDTADKRALVAEVRIKAQRMQYNEATEARPEAKKEIQWQ